MSPYRVEPNAEPTKTCTSPCKSQSRSTGPVSVLRICGVVLNHLRCQPALANGIITITFYGVYFTEPEERDDLVKILDRPRDLRSWPMQKAYRRFRHLLEVLSVSYS